MASKQGVYRIKSYQANAALVLVVAMSAILIIGGISVVLSSVDLGKSSGDAVSGSYARLNSVSCREEALYKIARDPNYVGDTTLSFDTGDALLL
ncbi:hypothetical protein GF357_01835 [Candidatus Dojkabacteria bacterium]|nr:hypothetical protein [Candidatus Dojkabacteria bacterium]